MGLSTFKHLGLLKSVQVTLLDEKSITGIYRILKKRNKAYTELRQRNPLFLKIFSAKSLEAIISRC